MREKTIEQHLIDKVEAEDGETRKCQWIGRSNAPDRFLLLHGVHMVEVKKPGEYPTEAQYREIDRINEHGGSAHWVNSFEMVDALIDKLCGYSESRFKHSRSLVEKVWLLHTEEKMTYADIAARFGSPWTRGSVAGLIGRYKEKHKLRNG